MPGDTGPISSAPEYRHGRLEPVARRGVKTHDRVETAAWGETGSATAGRYLPDAARVVAWRGGNRRPADRPGSRPPVRLANPGQEYRPGRVPRPVHHPARPLGQPARGTDR